MKDMGFEMADIFEEEADPGLGNGGLGRLAACYMDGMATDGVRGTGYSIRYEHGIFKQKIVEGQQVELPDSWLSTGEVWQIPAMDETREVKIGGTVDTYFDDNGKLVVNYHDYTPVLAFRMICRSPATAPTTSRVCACGRHRARSHWT